MSVRWEEPVRRCASSTTSSACGQAGQTAREADTERAATMSDLSRTAIAQWLHRPAWLQGSPGEHLIREAISHHQQADPAFVQTVRLLVKQQHRHAQLAQRAASRLDPDCVRPRSGPADRLTATVLMMPRVRFAFSVLLISELIECQVLDALRRADVSPCVSDVSRWLLRDKHQHLNLYAEHLTMAYTDFNFIRRNLRRARLRGMFVTLMTCQMRQHQPVIKSLGVNPAAFAARCWQSFNTELELMVPYHRERLAALLLMQQDRPFDEPTR